MKLRFWAVPAMAFCLVSCGDTLEFSVNEDRYMAEESAECQAGCGEKQICSRGTCVDLDCDDGEKRCSGRQPQVCSGNKWSDSGDVCVSGSLCKNGECTFYNNPCQLNGTYRCLNNASGAGLVYHCESGVWASPSMCPGSAPCQVSEIKESIAEVCGN